MENTENEQKRKQAEFTCYPSRKGPKDLPPSPALVEILRVLWIKYLHKHKSTRALTIEFLPGQDFEVCVFIFLLMLCDPRFCRYLAEPE
jgi:hypothetical protein